MGQDQLPKPDFLAKPIQVYTFEEEDLDQPEDGNYKNVEKARLLGGYQAPSDLAYPELMDFDIDSKYTPYAPIEKSDEKPVKEETKQDPAQPVTNRPAPSAENYVIHHVQPNDTIGKLCLQYNVNKDVIRMANDFLGEEIYQFKTLKIPYTYGKMYESLYGSEDTEETKKKFAIEMMSRTLKETYKNQKDFSKEAKYYLEMNGYNLEKAMSEFEADMEFEKQVLKENKEFKKKKRRQTRLGIMGCF